MKKYKDRNEPLANEFKPSLRDALALSTALTAFSPRKIGRRTHYPFELHLEQEGIIRFDDFGEIVIMKPMEYHRLSEVNDLRKWKDEKDQEQFFEAYPEEREKYQVKVREIMMSIRDLFLGKSIANNSSESPTI